MSYAAILTISRLGAFVVGCTAFSVASYYGWTYAGWLLVPTVAAGLMCCSLMMDDKAEKTK